MIFSLENRLLEMHASGVYLSSNDFIVIGSNLGILLPYKKRDIVLGLLINFAKEDNKEREVYKYLFQLIEERLKEYEEMMEHYPGSKGIIMENVNNGKKILLEIKNLGETSEQ